MNLVLDTVPAKVTAAMNESLVAPFDKDEIKRALFQMFPTKAPGLTVCQHISYSVIGSSVVTRLLKWYFASCEVRMIHL